MRCSCCTTAQGRCATTTSGQSVTECTSCGRIVEERQSQPHHLFHLRAHDTPLCLVTSDLPSLPHHHRPQSFREEEEEEEDPFKPTGFITAFSTWSLEPTPLFARSSFSFSGHLAELERALELSASSSLSSTSSSSSGPTVAVDNLRAYLQIIDVASILGLDCDISDHAFQLFRDCCSATCLRNRSVEALATAALVQAIREAQEPRTLQEPFRSLSDFEVEQGFQVDGGVLSPWIRTLSPWRGASWVSRSPLGEISVAANVPQKEVGKYIKILGEALQLSQPINSNSISVHMPRFCTLLQLNKSAQELATHIGEVVMNKCFCTRRNPISISAAAIYLACQLEDKRKTQAEICKVTGLTEVTLRKVYKELLENWDDLLPSNYTPAVPPEKAFPTTTIASGRSSVPKDLGDIPLFLDRDKRQPEIEQHKPSQVLDPANPARGKEDVDTKNSTLGTQTPVLNRMPNFWQPQPPIGSCAIRTTGEKNRGFDMNEMQKIEETKAASSSITWRLRAPLSSEPSPQVRVVKTLKGMPGGFAELKGSGNK